MTQPSIWWIRRDLRLRDNPALSRAVETGAGNVIPLFVLDPSLLAREAPFRQAFLFAGLRQLDADLQALGGRLILREGDPLAVLSALIAESGAGSLFAAEDFSPYARRRDRAVGQHLPLTLLPGVSARHPLAVLKPNGSPYTVFTPYSRAWRSVPLPEDGSLLPAPDRLRTPAQLDSQPLPEAAAPQNFPAGEVEALRRLEAFCAAPIFEYHAARDRIDLDGTSALSPYLRFGMLSPRQAFAAATRALASLPDGAAGARLGVDTWTGELIWREFYLSILYHFPEVLDGAFKPSMRGVSWQSDPGGLRAWQNGETGYPIVDAAMRCLAATGWMHNRARMITASFLCKHLLINWQSGERHFMRLLVDGDPAANNGGWQWVAGTGTDAAPYFRIFNPLLQGEKFDPRGEFVRRWLPELAGVPERYVHKPWLAPGGPPHAYPAPIVDHALARRRALDAYRPLG